jgi:hypothetical protein
MNHTKIMSLLEKKLKPLLMTLRPQLRKLHKTNQWRAKTKRIMRLEKELMPNRKVKIRKISMIKRRVRIQ